MRRWRLPHAWWGNTPFARPMLTDTLDPQVRPWAPDIGDPSEDRIMLAIQYATAIIAVLAAGLLSLVH
jgi:hypothetical protein